MRKLTMSMVTKSTAIILTFISSLFGSVNSQDLCSCSPQKYSFTVSLSQTCDNDTLKASPGVFTTVCSTDANVGADDWSGIIPDVGESLVRRFLTDEKPMRQMVTKDMTPVKIISLIFAEVNSDGSLVVINKDESLSETDLKDESVVEFDSISAKLDPDVGIDDQLSIVPGGVTVLLVGENASGELIKTRMLWLYDNSCNMIPLAEAADLGWISVDTIKRASEDFCAASGSDATLNSVKPKADKSEGKFVSKSGKSNATENSPLSSPFNKAGKVSTKAGKAISDEGAGVFVKSGKETLNEIMSMSHSELSAKHKLFKKAFTNK